MADEQQRSVIALHRLLDPFARGNVEVVGRLVENEKIDLLIHEHAELQPAHLAAGEHGNALKNVLARKMERREPVSRALGRHAAFGVEHGIDEITARHIECDDLR